MHEDGFGGVSPKKKNYYYYYDKKKDQSSQVALLQPDQIRPLPSMPKLGRGEPGGR